MSGHKRNDLINCSCISSIVSCLLSISFVSFIVLVLIISGIILSQGLNIIGLFFFGLWRAGFTPVFATSRTCGGNGVLEGLWWTGLGPVFATSRTCGGNGDLEGL